MGDVAPVSAASASAPRDRTNTTGADDDVRSLITQVSKDDNRPVVVAPVTWVPPRVPAPVKQRSMFQRLCACCFASSSTAEDEAAIQVSSTAPQAVALVPRQSRPKPAAQMPGALLPPMLEEHAGRKTLVLDLDETLVHSSFKPLPHTDFQIEVEVDGVIHPVYVSKRPSVDEFMRRMGECFEVVVFTASLAKYADPVMDLLDIHKVVASRLFREACSNHQGVYVKDLSRLGRPLKDLIIVDNSPTSYLFHPENAVPIGSWFDDVNDTELLDLIPFLEALTKVDDVCSILDPTNS